MTFTSDERCEIVKKMREYDVAEFKESAIVPFLDCLGHSYTDWRGILDELADLIDRPIYRPVIPNAMDGYVFCPQCGAEIGEYGVPNYCHSCGVAISMNAKRNSRKGM